MNYAEDLDLVIPMYNLIEYSSNYSETTGNLWFYSRYEPTNFLILIIILQTLVILNLSSIRLNYQETQKFSPIQIMLREF